MCRCFGSSSDSAVISANSAELDDLAADSAIDHLSGDPLVRVGMSISNQSTAADQVRAGVAGGLLGIGAIPGVSGQGIGVAIVDSGISPHAALVSKVVANVSLITGDPSVGDAFGHGTHVAGIIAGNATAARSVTPLFTGGLAPGVQLVNVRVLGADGVGRTSDVIAGIQWAIANRARYNIRIINLSLGHPVMEPAATDPLCEVVEQAVQAGIVVIAAAGNDGVTADGRMILGGINSPGNSPWAITVGSLNTWGTVKRTDDTVTSYSSRGPARFDGDREAGHRGAGQQDRVARGERRLHSECVSVPAPRRHRHEQLHAVERDEHGGADGERRRGAAAARHTEHDAGAGEDGAAGRRDLHARRGPDGRGRRQRELHGVAQGGNQPPRRTGVRTGWRAADPAERRDVLGRGHPGAAAVRRHRHPPPLDSAGAARLVEFDAAAFRRSEPPRPRQPAGVDSGQAAAVRRGRKLDQRSDDHVGLVDYRSERPDHHVGLVVHHRWHHHHVGRRR